MKVETFVCNMLRENCYVAYDESSREAAIIDPGLYWDEEAQTLDAFVRDHALTVKYMLCTHLHFDHIFGTTHVEDTYGVGISASDADSPWIAGFVQASSRFGIRPRALPRPVAHPLHDELTLMLGNEELHCIATPGHSAGGMCYYAPESAVLFSGDTLFLGSVGRTDLGSDGNHAQLVHSIRTRLLTLPPHTIVYPGHGDPTSIGDESRHNPYL